MDTYYYVPNIIVSADDVKITSELRVKWRNRHGNRDADYDVTKNIWIKLKEGHTRLTAVPDVTHWSQVTNI